MRAQTCQHQQTCKRVILPYLQRFRIHLADDTIREIERGGRGSVRRNADFCNHPRKSVRSASSLCRFINEPMRKFFYLIVLILAACQPADAVSSSPFPVPSATTTPTPASTFTPSPTPTVAELIAPYTIDGLQHHQFQSGKITITSTVETTDTYTRYLISYPSDSLTITGVMQIPVNGHPPYPVIIMNHGYFDREGYVPGDGTYRAAEYLNKYGYITLASDYRTWGKSDIGASFFYTGLAIDVINLMKAVSSIPQADPSSHRYLGTQHGRRSCSQSDCGRSTSQSRSVLFDGQRG